MTKYSITEQVEDFATQVLSRPDLPMDEHVKFFGKQLEPNTKSFCEHLKTLEKEKLKQECETVRIFWVFEEFKTYSWWYVIQGVFLLTEPLVLARTNPAIPKRHTFDIEWIGREEEKIRVFNHSFMDGFLEHETILDGHEQFTLSHQPVTVKEYCPMRKKIISNTVKSRNPWFDYPGRFRKVNPFRFLEFVKEKNLYEIPPELEYRKVITGYEWVSDIKEKPARQDISISEDKNLQWQDITLNFINEDEIVFQFKQNSVTRGFERLGFGDGRTLDKPISAWRILYRASKENGTIPWQYVKERKTIEKHVQTIRKKIKALFPGIQKDPIPLDKKNREYKPVFTLRILEKGKV